MPSPFYAGVEARTQRVRTRPKLYLKPCSLLLLTQRKWNLLSKIHSAKEKRQESNGGHGIRPLPFVFTTGQSRQGPCPPARILTLHLAHEILSENTCCIFLRAFGSPPIHVASTFITTFLHHPRPQAHFSHPDVIYT